MPPPSGSEQKSLNDTSSRKIPLAGKKAPKYPRRKALRGSETLKE
jgi:hypothetical protein